MSEIESVESFAAGLAVTLESNYTANLDDVRQSLRERDAAVRRKALEDAATLLEHRAASESDDLYKMGWYRGCMTSAEELRRMITVYAKEPARD